MGTVIINILSRTGCQEINTALLPPFHGHVTIPKRDAVMTHYSEKQHSCAALVSWPCRQSKEGHSHGTSWTWSCHPNQCPSDKHHGRVTLVS
nr:hypothetical protein Itr_chr03CG10030 [Ipomoea trifida]